MVQTDTNRYKRLFKSAPELRRASGFFADNKERIPIEVQTAFRELLKKLNLLLTENKNFKKLTKDCNTAYISFMAEISVARQQDELSILNRLEETGIYPSWRSDPLKKIAGIRFTRMTRDSAEIARAPSWHANILSGEYPGRLWAKDIKDRGIKGNRLVAGVVEVAFVAAVVMLYPHPDNITGVNMGRVAAGQLDAARETIGEQVQSVNQKARIDNTELEQFHVDKKVADARAKTDALIDKLIADKLTAEESARKAQDQQVKAEESARKAHAESSPKPVNAPTAGANTPSKGGVGACTNLPEGVRASMEAWVNDGKPLSLAEQNAAVNALEASGQRDIVRALGADQGQINPKLVRACLSR